MKQTTIERTWGYMYRRRLMDADSVEFAAFSRPLALPRQAGRLRQLLISSIRIGGVTPSYLVDALAEGDHVVHRLPGGPVCVGQDPTGPEGRRGGKNTKLVQAALKNHRSLGYCHRVRNRGPVIVASLVPFDGAGVRLAVSLVV